MFVLLFCEIIFINMKPYFNPMRPLRRKLRIRWFFDVSKVKDLTDPPPQIFDAHILENTDLCPSRFHFSVVLGQDHVLSQMVL